MKSELAPEGDVLWNLDYLRFLTWEGWQHKLVPRFDQAEAAGHGRGIFSEVREQRGDDPYVPESVYAARLRHEIDLLHRKDYVRYFLLVEDIYRFIHEQGIPRGDSRGSIGASLTAYLLNMTLVDPLRHDLLFDRFLNEARHDPPDVDMDIAVSRREEVYQYLRDRYGADRVAKLATVMTFKGKSVVQFVARAFGVSLAETVDATRHMVTRAKGDARAHRTVEDSCDLPGFREYAALYPEIIRHAIRLEGQWSGLGKHAAGTVVAARPLHEFAPVIQHGGEPMLGVDMAALAMLGLLKIDLLGLRPPEVMEAAFHMIRDRHDMRLCECAGCREVQRIGAAEALKTGDFLTFYDQIPLEDAAVLAMLAEGKTYGIMQLETPGMTKLMGRMQPTRFSQIAAANAIHRPGAMRTGGTDRYVRRLRGEEPVPKIDPVYDRITAETQGVVCYQEQLMQLANQFAGYSAGDTEGLRRLVQKSMGREIIAKQETVFVTGALQEGHAEDVARWVFSQIVEAGAYSFNQAHAVGYSQTSVRQGWFKRHFLAEFLCACLNSTRAADKISGFMREAERMGIPVFRPHIQRSGVNFEIRTVNGQTAIQAGFAILREVGEKPARTLVETLAREGPFQSYDHFLSVTPRSVIGKRVVQALAGSGALEPLIPNCGRLMEGLDLLWDNKTKRDAHLREEWLCSCLDGSEPGWTEDERTLSQAHWLMMPPERSILKCYRAVLAKIDARHRFLSVAAMEAQEEYPSALLIVLITSVKESFRERESGNDDDEDGEENPFLGWAALTIEDESDFVMATCDPDTWERLRPVLEKAAGQAAILRVQKRPGSDRVNVVEATLLGPFAEKLGADSPFYSAFENYLLFNPLATYERVRAHFEIESLDSVLKRMRQMGKEPTRVWGSIVSRRLLKTRKDGRPFMLVTLEEGGHQAEVMVWPDEFERFQKVLEGENLVAMKVVAMPPNDHSSQWKLVVPRGGRMTTLSTLETIWQKTAGMKQG